MKRGDVAILDHPYSDRSGAKVRPALVVQNDRDNHRMTNTIVVLISRNISRVGAPTQVLIDLTTAEGRQSGLNQTSAVVCTNLFTVAQAKVRKVIGSLPPSLMSQVDGGLRAALELP